MCKVISETRRAEPAGVQSSMLSRPAWCAARARYRPTLRKVTSQRNIVFACGSYKLSYIRCSIAAFDKLELALLYEKQLS